jgi:hypothetical protein
MKVCCDISGHISISIKGLADPREDIGSLKQLGVILDSRRREEVEPADRRDWCGRIVDELSRGLVGSRSAVRKAAIRREIIFDR